MLTENTDHSTDEHGALAGTILAKTYKLDRLLAEGGMGAVYLGRHLRTGGLCAVKVLHPQSAANTDIYERFLAEARVISTLRHPHIVHVSDLNDDDRGMPFLVMELLEGEDLEARLQREGKLPLPAVLNLAREVGSAMQAAHNQGVVHRDLKPRNIFLARYEVGGRSLETVKVIDFGVSKIPRPASRATRNQLVLGTPRYVAPEGALGQNSEIDGRADQFSLAVILYRALSARLPFDSDSVVELLRQIVVDSPPPLGSLVPGLPAHIEKAIERAMEKSKVKRFPTIMDFVNALEAVEGRAPTMRMAVSKSGAVTGSEEESEARAPQEPAAAQGSAGQRLSEGPRPAPPRVVGVPIPEAAAPPPPSKVSSSPALQKIPSSPKLPQAPEGRGRPDSGAPQLMPEGRGRPDSGAPQLAPEGRGRPDAGPPSSPALQGLPSSPKLPQVSPPPPPRASVVLSAAAVQHIAAQRARAEEHTLAPPTGRAEEHATLQTRPLDRRRTAVSAAVGAVLCALAYLAVLNSGGSRGPRTGERPAGGDKLVAATSADAGGATTRATPGSPEPGVVPPPAWERFEQAVARSDADAALKALHDIPADSPFAGKARPRYQELFRWFAALHLQQAEAGRQAGQCQKTQEEVQRVLDLEPLHREALMARWRHCGVTFYGAGSRDPYRQLGYPPLRPFLGLESQAAASSPPPAQNDDQMLREAQLAHAHKSYLRAIDLAHGVVGGDPQNTSMAWRLIAVSACARGRAELAGAAYDRLDPASRDFVRVQCERAGLTGFR